MQMRAREAGLKNPMLIKDKSMDTLGNALFSKFELIQERRLSQIKKVLVYTSNFHTPRAYIILSVFISAITHTQSSLMESPQKIPT